MIQRDYILRMIEELRRMLVGIGALKEERRWREVEGTLEEQFHRLLGISAAESARLSETELSARLIQGEATQIVREKALLLIRLFKESGDAATAQDQPDQAQAYYLKGLHLLLAILGEHEPFERPDYVPPVEKFTTALANAQLPARTHAMLMHHYERAGAFGKAEDELHALFQAAPNIPEVYDLGISFYERLLGRSDEQLAAGNLPRDEIKAARDELQQWKTAVPDRITGRPG